MLTTTIASMRQSEVGRLIQLTLLLCFGAAPTEALISIVTGASGYVGKAVVQELLQCPSDVLDSRKVICLVRPSRVSSERQFWTSKRSEWLDNNQPSSSRELEVMEYDMLDGGDSLRQALAACQSEKSEEVEPICVFHVASVFGPTEDHSQTALDNVRGTEDLIHVLADHQSANTGNCRVQLVLTSSMAAVRGSGQEPGNGQFYTHEDWNTVSEFGTSSWGSSYQWSKAQSERRAHELCREHHIPLTALNPSFVFGPSVKLQNDSCNGSSDSFSLQLVGQWARGESPVQSRLFVDIRDVARVHVLAAAAQRSDDSQQRYIVSTECRVPSSEIAQWLQEVAEMASCDPDRIHYDAEFTGGAIPVGNKEVEAADRLQRAFGVELQPVKDTICDMARELLLQEQPQT